tara:strand:- start:3959 stop:4210 length:252 start_codon:yes stop_codon:yes gene_type:complete
LKKNPAFEANLVQILSILSFDQIFEQKDKPMAAQNPEKPQSVASAYLRLTMKIVLVDFEAQNESFATKRSSILDSLIHSLISE